MNQGLEYYKNFIDGLVERKNCVDSRWILNDYYTTLSSLTPTQKEFVAQLVQEARMGGIHDTLAYMNEMMDLDNLVLSKNGIALPHNEFASLHYDFVARCDGQEWPESQI